MFLEYQRHAASAGPLVRLRADFELILGSEFGPSFGVFPTSCLMPGSRFCMKEMARLSPKVDAHRYFVGRLWSILEPLLQVAVFIWCVRRFWVAAALTF